ncbi:MAG: hypothetical protein ING60_13070 [Rhodocyclaceae bacterium]|nr:hypothetical protein [Rhodocyclaceae bacterium]
MAAMLASLGGCASLSNGGAPPILNEDKNALAELGKKYGAGNFVNSSVDELGRNDLIFGRVQLINLNYYKWLADLKTDKQFGDTATDLTILGLGIAGTATKALRAKTNLAAAVVAVGAGKSIIDKNYFYDKTLPALISMMEAARQTKLLEIRQKMSKDMTEYSVMDAKQDLDEFERAGTLDVGIQTAIQSGAAQAKDKIDKINEIPVVTAKDVDNRAANRKAINALNDDDFEKAKQVLVKMEPKGAAAPKDMKEARERLRALHKKSSDAPELVESLYKELTSAEIKVAR